MFSLKINVMVLVMPDTVFSPGNGVPALIKVIFQWRWDGWVYCWRRQYTSEQIDNQDNHRYRSGLKKGEQNDHKMLTLVH